MYELAYCPWFIVVATAATKGLSTRLGEVWNRVSILHSNQGVNKVYFFKTDPGFWPNFFIPDPKIAVNFEMQ